jgi:ElaA protein
MTFYSKFFPELSGREVYEILRSRCQVFTVEQRIVCQEIDGVDYDSLHCFFTDEDGRVAAYLRAYYGSDSDTVCIGRALTLDRGVGNGRALMEMSLKAINEKMKPKHLTLHSQTHAVGFYKKFGFTVCSEEFLEEGIPHVMMKKTI